MKFFLNLIKVAVLIVAFNIVTNCATTKVGRADINETIGQINICFE